MMASIGGLLSLRQELWALLQVDPEEDEVLEYRNAGADVNRLTHRDRRRALGPLKDWFDAVDAVGRGSDAHVFLAVQYRERARAAAADPGGVKLGDGSAASEETRTADLACALAHIVRYGHVEDVIRESPSDAGASTRSLLWELVQIRSRLAAGSTMAARISAMAWEMDRRREGKREAQL